MKNRFFAMRVFTSSSFLCLVICSTSFYAASRIWLIDSTVEAAADPLLKAKVQCLSSALLIALLMVTVISLWNVRTIGNYLARTGEGPVAKRSLKTRAIVHSYYRNGTRYLRIGNQENPDIEVSGRIASMPLNVEFRNC